MITHLTILILELVVGTIIVFNAVFGFMPQPPLVFCMLLILVADWLHTPPRKTQ